MELLTGKPFFGFMGRSETTERLGAGARQFQHAPYTFLQSEKAAVFLNSGFLR
ncbi:hypothetical protein ACFOU2_12305 [Bacillus songklensis]|uniref:Uncharacterized protein n=1 Tax=Bacillus songklensis TaxID=1069116 RepID=A0ABV8B3V3_9BACI